MKRYLIATSNDYKTKIREKRDSCEPGRGSSDGGN
jgi:hypothetical protein